MGEFGEDWDEIDFEEWERQEEEHALLYQRSLILNQRLIPVVPGQQYIDDRRIAAW